MRDEAEIRGHRRTYIGSMPGKIIQSMKKAKTTNTFFLLDEIEKMGADWRGDPSSALLEVLDPEQNSTFNDHYLEVDYDLSNVMFVTTANSLNMPQPLMDRMEIIRIPGYTEDEKIEIAKRHLLPKLAKDHGLKEGEWTVPDAAIRDLIRYYTREAGVRSLERELGNLARKAVRDMAREHAARRSTIDEARLGQVRRRAQVPLRRDRRARPGRHRHRPGLDRVRRRHPHHRGAEDARQGPDVDHRQPQGGDEGVASPPPPPTSAPGRPQFGVKPPPFDKTDVHVHVPEGATPKDGPSAGVAMAVAIISVLTGVPVRKDIAMTGEITLRGRVLPIGGLKEKLLAALRSGVKTVLIPAENEKDLAEVPEIVKAGLEIIPVATVDEVLKLALTGPLAAIEWREEDEPLVVPPPATTAVGGLIITH